MSNADDNWRILERAGFSVLVVKSWQSDGVIHGFLGIEPILRQELSRKRQALILKEALGIEALYIAEQTHSINVLKVSSPCDSKDVQELGKGDAIIITASSGTRSGVVIYTADCVPLLMRCGKWVAAVHAGWKGLADGIINNAVQSLVQAAGCKSIEVAIGPCAGSDCYQVGPDVIDAIGSSAFFSKDISVRDTQSDRYLLDLAATAASQVRTSTDQNEVKLASINIAKRCTIRGHYHSYRRDREDAGRNLSFIVAGSVR